MARGTSQSVPITKWTDKRLVIVDGAHIYIDTARLYRTSGYSPDMCVG
jgi:hypothetical protein